MKDNRIKYQKISLFFLLLKVTVKLTERTDVKYGICHIQVRAYYLVYHPSSTIPMPKTERK